MNALTGAQAAPPRTGQKLHAGRGRPRGRAETDVPQRIFAAAERIIEEKGHFAVTDKEVAKAAGISVAMINYYFQNKGELLFALVDEFCAGLAVALAAAEDIAKSPTGRTRDMIALLVRAYSARPALSRLIICEFGREESVVRQRFMTRYGARAMLSLTRIFDDLARRGIYHRPADSGHAAFALLSLLCAPILIANPLRPSGRAAGPGFDEAALQSWIDYVTDLFDRQLRRP